MQPQQNTGSFGAAISPGAGDPIQEALMRRSAGGGGAPTTAQSSMTQTPVPAPIPQTNPTPATGQSMGAIATQPPIAGMPPQMGEAELIIKSLSQRLASLSKISEAQSIPPKPQVGGI